MNIELYLPFPPSINNYYVKSKSGGKFISVKGKKFRADVHEAIIEQAPALRISGKVLIETVLFPPDLRRRDIDNFVKPLLDALTHAEVWDDDSQIDQHFNYRGVKVYGGQTLLRITDAGPLIPEGQFPI